MNAEFLVTLNVSVVVVVIVDSGVDFFSFSTSLELLHGFASNFGWMFLGATPVFDGIMGNFVQFLAKYWFGESPGGVVSNLFKLGCCDLYLRF